MSRLPKGGLPPVSAESLERLRRREEYLKQTDPSYVSYEDAKKIPEEIRNEPDVKARVAASAQHWPERHGRMRELTKDLPPGCGETVTDRSVDAAELFGVDDD
jgi:hypothetical protein